MFDGPQRAIRCAMAIRDAVQALGIEVRAGLHTGECEVRGDDIGGIAVHIGARVSALAGPNEVLVSSTLRDLVIGSGLEFEDRGAHDSRACPANGVCSPSPLGKSADRRSEGRRLVVGDDPRFFAGLFVQSCFPVVSPLGGNVIGPVLGAGTSTLGHHRGPVSTPLRSGTGVNTSVRAIGTKAGEQ